MKQGTNNDIDLLLRKLGQRAEPDSAFAGIDDEHLDADELNSYAENALPDSARARYTAHLADCSSCRKIVAQLSVASGSVVHEKTTEVRAPSGLMKFLASLFSPLVLRYAIPAVSLIAIVAVGIVVFQRQPAAEFTAQKAVENRSVIFDSPPKEQAATQPSTAGNAGTKSEPTKSESTSSDKRTDEARAQATPASDRPEDESRQEAKVKKQDDAPAVAAEQPVYAPEPTTPAAAPKRGADKEEQTSAEVAQNRKPAPQATRVDTKSLAKAPAKEVARNVDDVSAADSGPAKSERPSASGGVASIAGSREKNGRAVSEKDAGRDNKNEAELRTVAGRRFRKEGRVWIDTAYESSRSTINVSRGSEQFRALAADEPAIHAIAEQLDGEVVVVWKGRAYRIR